MPQLRPQAIDSLWQYLCPSFDQHALNIGLVHYRVSRNRASSIVRRLAPKPSSRRALVTIIPSHPKNPTFWKPKHIGTPLPKVAEDPSSQDAKKAQDNSDGEHGLNHSQDIQSSLGEVGKRQNLTNEELHAVLLTESENANYKPVQDIIKFLVGERGERPSKAHYQALLAVQADLKNGSAAEVERLLQEMQDNDIDLDAVGYSAVLKALAVHPHYMLRCHIIDEMERSWITLNNADHQHIAAGLLKDRQFELAWDRLGLMQTKGFYPEPWLLNLFLYTLSSISAWQEVATILNGLPSQEQFRIPAMLWLHLLHSVAREHHQPLISAIWNRAVKTGFINPPSGLCTTILESCAANGDTTTAADVFKLLGQRSSLLQSWHYESLFEAYLVSGDTEGVLSSAHIMTKAGFPLTEENTRALYTHLQENPEMISDILGIITTPSFVIRDPVSIAFINAILEALLVHDNLPAALDIFDNLHKYTPDPATVVTLNTLLRGCAQASQKDTAMSLARKMCGAGVVPTALTYDRLILTCLTTKKREDLDDAWRYYEELMAASVSHSADETWGIRRGTVRLLMTNCVSHGDRRAYTLLGQCAANGMDVSVLRRELEQRWQSKWGSVSPVLETMANASMILDGAERQT